MYNPASAILKLDDSSYMLGMLIRFWVENYRCFRKRVEIDFTDKRNYAFGKECVRGDLLEKVVITGENGAGKTSFGYALVDIVTTLNGFTKDIGQNSEECFINGFGDSDVAVFHYEFSHRGSFVVYEYSKPSVFEIRSERMTIDGSAVFDYDLTDMSTAVFKLDRIGIRWAPDPSALDGKVPLMRMLDEKALIDMYSPARPIVDFSKRSLYYLAMWRMDDHIGQVDYDVKVAEYIVDSHLERDLQAFMRDQCGVDLDIRVSSGRLVVVIGSREVPFFKGVSRGMAIMCRLFAWITKTRDRDALIYFDDFDDLFDYRTAERVMGYIIKGSPSQCIFVTHNIDLIASEHLRPDCCFIMRGRQLRSLASLTDKTLRRGHNLAKMIRDGVFDVPPERSQGRVPGSAVDGVRRAGEDPVQQVQRPVHAEDGPLHEAVRDR